MPEPLPTSSGTPQVIYQPPQSSAEQSWSPLKIVSEVPCARNSLLSGIASGAGIGIIRGLSASAFVASNWAVGTFMLISIGSWHICQKAIRDEHMKVQSVVEKMPGRFVKQQAKTASSSIEPSEDSSTTL